MWTMWQKASVVIKDSNDWKEREKWGFESFLPQVCLWVSVLVLVWEHRLWQVTCNFIEYSILLWISSFRNFVIASCEIRLYRSLGLTKSFNQIASFVQFFFCFWPFRVKICCSCHFCVWCQKGCNFNKCLFWTLGHLQKLINFWSWLVQMTHIGTKVEGLVGN